MPVEGAVDLREEELIDETDVLGWCAEHNLHSDEEQASLQGSAPGSRRRDGSP